VNAHDDMLDSVALLALGTLPEHEARSVAEHARTCAQCRAEYAGLRAAADAVGYAAELAPGELDEISAARMKASVMRAVRAGQNGVFSRPDFAFPVRTPARGPGVWLPYLAAAVALVFAALSWANVTSLRSENARLQTQEQTAQRFGLSEERLAVVTAPGSKHYSVPMGEVVTSEGRVFLALRMSALAPGKVYQAWTLRAGARAVAPSVTFAAEPGVTFVELPESAGGIAAVAVSVEPAGGSKAPTSKPAFIRTLS
jgi:hypothetical protein